MHGRQFRYSLCVVQIKSWAFMNCHQRLQMHCTRLLEAQLECVQRHKVPPISGRLTVDKPLMTYKLTHFTPEEVPARLLPVVAGQVLIITGLLAHFTCQDLFLCGFWFGLPWDWIYSCSLTNHVLLLLFQMQYSL